MWKYFKLKYANLRGDRIFDTKSEELVIVKSVRLHPSRENKYLEGREVVKKKRSFYGQDNRKG